MDHRQLSQNDNSCPTSEKTRKLSVDLSKFEQLNWAVSRGNRELIDSLLKEGAPVNFFEDYDKSRTVLHSAISLGNPEIVKLLLARGASVNIGNCNGETPLMIAAKMENNVLTDLLLKSNELLNCHSKEKLTHLHIASMRNQVEIVRNLIKTKTDINAAIHPSSISWPGYTPLHFAVHYHCHEMVDYLLSIGADITTADARKLTPLHLANTMRNERIIDSILIRHKNVTGNPVNSEGLSHFHIACTRNYTDVVKYFIENGVDLQCSVPETSLNWCYFTAMDFAIHYGCVDVVRLLLSWGDHIKSPSDYIDRKSAAYQTGNVDLIHLLDRKNQFKNEESVGIRRIPDLHMSCINGNLESVEKILSKSPSSLNNLTWRGSLSVHLAIENKNIEVAKYLLSQGADYNEKNSQGKSALHLAFDYGMQEIMDLILSDYENFNLNPVDTDCLSHLHIACTRNKVEAVKRFIEIEADINAQVSFQSVFRSGFSPLHFAVESQSTGSVRLLLDHKASYALTDARNLAPFDLAIQQTRKIFKRSDALRMMGMILDSHAALKLDSFNDRGFSRLHFMSMEYSRRVSHVKEYINEHPSDVNKSVHRLNSYFDGYTPLHFAASSGLRNVIKLLLESGADLLFETESGDTPLYLAMFNRHKNGILTILHDFLQVQQSPVEIKDYSFFHVVCAAGNIELIKFHLEHGSDPNCRIKRLGEMPNNSAPLHLIASHCFSPAVEVATLLIKHGADPNARDFQMNTPLHYLGDTSEHKIIDTLVSRGADVNALNAYFETPLLRICDCALDMWDDQVLVNLIRSLINNGADINLANDKGITPLTVHCWDLILENNEEDEINEYYLETVGIFLKHVIKLGVIGSHISETNRKAYLSLLNKYSGNLNLNQANFGGLCIRELELMKRTSVDRYTTLYDILFKNFNELAITNENGAFHDIIKSDDFDENFPIYGFMLQLRLKMGILRRPLLKESLNALNFLICMPLPGDCKERILQYLDEYDLKNLIMSKESL